MRRAFEWAWKRAMAGRPSLLTRVFWHWIPFNRPHRFRIEELREGRARVVAPTRRANRNHLGTLHACALATVGEFAAGLALLGAFNPSDYRLIMSRLEVDYVRRAKGQVSAEAEVVDALVGVRHALQEQGVVAHQVMSTLTDASGQTVARVITHWQIKDWQAVRDR